MKKDKKHKQRLSNQLKKPEKEKKKLRKLKLNKWRKKASDLVSEQAYFAWRDKLQHRDFIGERGFGSLIPPFQEIIEKRRWHYFYEHKAPGFVDMVKEFYANMVGMKEKTVYIRGKWILYNQGEEGNTFVLHLKRI